MRWLILAVLASLCMSGPALAQNLIVNVDAIADGAFDRAAVHEVVPTREQSEDLVFAEMLQVVRRGLAASGLQLREDPQQPADVLISVDYSVSGPKSHTYTRQIPVQGVVGTEKAKTTFTPTWGNNVEATTTYQEKRGVVGYRDETISYTTHTRRLRLEAVDRRELEASGRRKVLWTTELSSEGASDDLRYVLPFMVQSGVKYFGRSSGHRVEVKLKRKDKNVEVLRSGVARK